MTSDMRDWGALEDGPAGLIADRLLAHDVADYVRFRSMCRTWRRCSAHPRAHGGLDRRFHPRRWVMLQEPLGTPNNRCFLNTSTGKFFQVDLPELLGHHHHVLAHTPEGLLVLLQQQSQLTTVRLLNPFTRHLIELPPLTSLLSQDEQLVLSLTHGHSRCFGAWGSGIANDGSTVVLCLYNFGVLGVAKPGDRCWTWTVVRFDNRLKTSRLMFAGRFYLTDRSTEPAIFNLDGSVPQPHTLVDCLSLPEKFSLPLIIRRNVVSYESFIVASSVT